MPRGIPATREFYSAGLTPTQRANLEKLWTYLENVKEIRMDSFVTSMSEELSDLGVDDDFPEELFEAREKNVCGTVCCLAGNGPLAGVKARKLEDWHEYAKRVFGADGTGWAETKPAHRVWEFLFDACWHGVDDTVKGGRARIRMVLDHGVPLNFAEQQSGDEPLSYLPVSI